MAYIDESFQEDPVHGFYVMAAAVFEPTISGQVRDLMLDLRTRLRGRKAGDKLHWNHLDRHQQESAAKQVAEIEGFHVVTIGSPVPRRRQERARAVCLTKMVVELHSLDVHQALMEAREHQLNQRDVRTVAAARFSLPKGSSFRVEHQHGIREPLLWVADLVAGAVRAHRLGAPTCRDLLADCVYEIEVDTDC